MAKTDPFAKLLADADKKYNISIGPMRGIATDTKFISTGNMSIDYAFGGGIPLGRITELAGAPSSGKAQRWNDVVHTPDRGFVKISDLKEGDRLSSPSGGESVLTGIFPQGKKAMFRFNLSDGTSAVSTENHLWTVDTLTAHLGLSRVTVEAKDIIKAMKKSSYRSRDINLPLHEPVRTDDIQLPLDPYLLGALLGDGSVFDGTPVITSADPEIIDRVKKALPEGVNLVYAAKSGKAVSYRLSRTDYTGSNPLTEILRELGVWGHKSYTKFIPEIYLRSSFDQRLALLQGLMDTDGYARGYKGASKNVQNAIFYSSSEQLALDVASLARSVGSTAFIRDKIPTYVYKDIKKTGAKAYRVEMREMTHKGFSVFHLTRKRPTGPEQMRNRRRKFVSVESIGSEEAVCISVSSADHLYFTNDYIPTHNTTTALQAAVNLYNIIVSGGDPEMGIKPDDHIIYFDYEQAMDPDYAEALGLNLDDGVVQFSQPDTLEEGANYARDLIKTGRVRMVIFDSLAAMTPSAKAEADIGKSLPAIQAKLMTDFGAALNPILREHQTAAVFINHEREKMNMGGRPGMAPVITTPGGVAMKYYASLRASYKQIRKNMSAVIDPLTGLEENMVTSTDVIVSVPKNKVAPPYRKAEVKVRFGKGFDNFSSALTILTASKYIMHSSPNYFFHKLEDQGLAPDWMPRLKTGTQRPYIKGKPGVFKASDEHPEWRQAIIDLGQKVALENAEKGITTQDEDDDDGDEVEDLSDVLDAKPDDTTRRASLTKK